MMTPTLLLVAGMISAPPLPDWHGEWAGTLVVPRADGKPIEVPMTLKIQPIDGGRLSWTIVRGEGEKKQTLQYELVPVAGQPDRFEIDEKNGIRLPARLAEGRLVMLYKVGGTLMHVRYERAGETIRFDLTAFAEKGLLVTSPDGQELRVEAYSPGGGQFAELRRVKR